MDRLLHLWYHLINGTLTWGLESGKLLQFSCPQSLVEPSLEAAPSLSLHLFITGAALEHVLHIDFKPNVGMRSDSRKILILITDGESQDNVTDPSQNLRDTGIEIYTVGEWLVTLNNIQPLEEVEHRVRDVSARWFFQWTAVNNSRVKTSGLTMNKCLQSVTNSLVQTSGNIVLIVLVSFLTLFFQVWEMPTRESCWPSPLILKTFTCTWV